MSAHRTTRASPAEAAHARSRSLRPSANYSFRGIPRSILSPPLRAPALHPRKSLSSEIQGPAAPSLFRFAQTPRFPMSCPRHLSPRVDPDPILSSSQTAPACLLPPTVSPPPSSKSTQSPPSSHPGHQAYLSPPLHAWCKPPHRYCRIPRPRSPLFVISDLHLATPGSLSPSEGIPALLYPSLCGATPPSKCSLVSSNTPPRIRRLESPARQGKAGASPALSVSPSFSSSFSQ